MRAFVLAMIFVSVACGEPERSDGPSPESDPPPAQPNDPPPPAEPEPDPATEAAEDCHLAVGEALTEDAHRAAAEWVGVLRSLHRWRDPQVRLAFGRCVGLLEVSADGAHARLSRAQLHAEVPELAPRVREAAATETPPPSLWGLLDEVCTSSSCTSELEAFAAGHDGAPALALVTSTEVTEESTDPARQRHLRTRVVYRLAEDGWQPVPIPASDDPLTQLEVFGAQPALPLGMGNSDGWAARDRGRGILFTGPTCQPNILCAFSGAGGEGPEVHCEAARQGGGGRSGWAAAGSCSGAVEALTPSTCTWRWRGDILVPEDPDVCSFDHPTLAPSTHRAELCRRALVATRHRRRTHISGGVRAFKGIFPMCRENASKLEAEASRLREEAPQFAAALERLAEQLGEADGAPGG